MRNTAAPRPTALGLGTHREKKTRWSLTNEKAAPRKERGGGRGGAWGQKETPGRAAIARRESAKGSVCCSRGGARPWASLTSRGGGVADGDQMHGRERERDG